MRSMMASDRFVPRAVQMSLVDRSYCASGRPRGGETMQEIELSAGIIEYEDTGGSGPVGGLLHGFVTDSSLWRRVVRELGDAPRCVVPTFPLGSPRRPRRADADPAAQ